ALRHHPWRRLRRAGRDAGQPSLDDGLRSRLPRRGAGGERQPPPPESEGRAGPWPLHPGADRPQRACLEHRAAPRRRRALLRLAAHNRDYRAEGLGMKRPKIALIGTGGTISSMGRGPFDIADYATLGKVMSAAELLAFWPQVAEVAEVIAIPYRAVPSTALGPKEWLE